MPFENIFITGGAGYVGAVLVPRLLGEGCQVTVLDLMIYGETVLAPHPHLTIIKGDIRDQALLQTSRAYSEAGADYGFYPADPMARQVGRVFMDSVVEESEVTGLEGLRKARTRGPCVVVCNHLSYVDTQTTDVLLQRHGAIDIADALLAVAGPKV